MHATKLRLHKKILQQPHKVCIIGSKNSLSIQPFIVQAKSKSLKHINQHENKLNGHRDKEAFSTFKAPIKPLFKLNNPVLVKPVNKT